jgi:hypothetical protein
LNAKNIFLSEGKYFYNNNVESTTKKLNKNLFKKIYNSFILYEILEKENPSFSNPSVIMSYTWEAYIFFNIHKKNLDNEIEWRNAISDGLVKIKEKKLFFSLTFKEKIKYILLKIQGYLK